jgi:hypothetical protein
MNTSFVIAIFALVAAVVFAAPNHAGKPNENNRSWSEFTKLTPEQRICIAGFAKNTTSVIPALKNCYNTNGGIACVRAIPALAPCFPAAG